MILAFVDETSDSRHPDYFGLCVGVMNSAFYRAVKEAFQGLLSDSGWDPAIEFKGACLFSASRGCQEIPVDKRVELASEVLDLTASRKNTRIKFFYLRARSEDHAQTYSRFLPRMLKRALPSPAKAPAKNVVAVHCDQRSDINYASISDLVITAVNERGYTLFENIIFAKSGFHTVGILYADIIAYLLGRIDTISMDSELFEGITEEDYARSGKLRQLRSSKALIEKVRFIKKYKVARRVAT